jgi:hypothetical protein
LCIEEAKGTLDTACVTSPATTVEIKHWQNQTLFKSANPQPPFSHN